MAAMSNKQVLYLVEVHVFILFGGINYIQRFGAAMGLIFAPPFACIFMGWLETKMLNGFKGTLPELWRRYIDDIFFLWRGNKEQLLHFISYLNNFHPTITFKCVEGEHFNFETRSVDFLDTTIFIDDDGFLQTKLYTKSNKKYSIFYHHHLIQATFPKTYNIH